MERNQVLPFCCNGGAPKAIGQGTVGRGMNGATKIHHCQGIADIINKTVIFPRNAKGVRCKVDKIHEKFKQAHYFVNSQTGAGIH